MPAATPEQIDSFITRWENSGAAERANYQMFLSELCDILEVPRPDPTSPDPAKNLHVFDRAITRVNPDGSSVTNVLEKLRSGEPLTAKEKLIHDQGLVTVLRQIHDELDETVLEACGWGDLSAKGTPCSGGLRPSIANEEAAPLVPNGIDGHRPTLQGTSSTNDEELLTRLVALNHERAAEEKRGLIRWLRPEYQNPTKASDGHSDGHRPPLQATLAGTETSSQSPISNLQSPINPSLARPPAEASRHHSQAHRRLRQECRNS
jgi:hypothetical protein